MKLFSSALLALVLASGAFAAPNPEITRSFHVKEVSVAPRGWRKIAPAPANHIIHLRIGLPQSNFAELERHLFEISDPFHPRYGQHLSKAEVEALIVPKKASLDLVDGWLASFGLGEDDLTRSSGKDWIVVRVPISVAEKMLNTKYHVWKYEDTDEHLIRTTEYGVPKFVKDHVELVQPTTLFARWSKMRTTIHFDKESFFEDKVANFFGLKDSHRPGDLSEVDASCNQTTTIDCLRDLYNFADYEPKASKENAIGISSYLDEYANLQDLKSFYQEQRPEAVNSTFEFVSVNGGKNDQELVQAGIEANLDVQFAFGLSWPTRNVAWSTAGKPPFRPDEFTSTNTNEPYQEWMDFVIGSEKVPQTISTSYGEEEQTIPFSYAERVCKSIAILGARGTSMIFSSGDGGVGDGSTDPNHHQCHTNDGRNVTRFMPSFPATSTAVGGTNNIPEEAVFFSGGGFSDYFSRPEYQSKVVEGYLAQLPEGMYSGLYNSTGRGFPDVAAMGRRFRIWWQGNATSIAGTSASAPTFAAVIALLNDVRISQGQKPLGFLNPWLYSQGLNGLNDITKGNNPGCGTQGFNATKGWDPLTGLGTPDFGKLRKLLPAADYQPLKV
ncbi:Tripeptidyl-peptidase sed3 [Leucoagaricus sp. SymC.cos]|nr:Tripeptidyl-peptidase sed3 [Leucoagaricus sp. SymC.cos]